ncbi:MULTISPECIES: WcbI family polysaccharide biosynthesis putative acetyltransferase [unclassified Brevundimonas]|uniref:WcbI family polysaccharide biosynthesis putative acetyltransferase n=1 Tax=unclassified Brevundimonas TaxID=2622653 RepID=UPI0025BBB433|nr:MULTISPECIES: WcbI family polysaccharide biosynthesis putative acetyltransferase [unclassified Brevundimonas]
MKIVFIGNCQAQALTQITHFLGLGAELVIVPPVFDLGSFNTPEIKEKIYSADVVFSQRVNDDYPAEFVRPSVLRQELGDKVVIWPNIYFDGYFPGVRYVYAQSGAKLTGPLSDYHFLQIQKSYAEGASVQEAWEAFTSPRASEVLPADPIGDSIANLRHREQDVDVKMSDYIEANAFRTKMFYSMNHPTDEVLLEALRRMVAHAGIDLKVPDYDPSLFDGYPYSLNEIDLPILPFVQTLYDMPASPIGTIVGRELVFDGTIHGAGPEPQTFTGVELIEAFYKVYESAEAADAVFLQGYD